MEEQVESLVKKIWEKYQDLPASQRLLVGIAGIPGSGKTTLAATFSTSLNALAKLASKSITNGTSNGTTNGTSHGTTNGTSHGTTNTSNGRPVPDFTAPCAFIPMDGYHLTRAQLSALPSPDTAHARRGAAFTFDSPSYLALIRQLRAPITISTPTIYAPSFDHAVKDPVPNDISIAASARIVVVEGNYVALDEGPWREARVLFDVVVFVEVEESVARKRLVERHLSSGIARSREEAERRAEENDLVNGRMIMERRTEVDVVVRSVEEKDWVI